MLYPFTSLDRSFFQLIEQYLFDSDMLRVFLVYVLRNNEIHFKMRNFCIFAYSLTPFNEGVKEYAKIQIFFLFLHIL